MNRVYRSYHKQNRWLSCGAYRPPVGVDWRALLIDVTLGSTLGVLLLVVALKLMGA